MRWRIPTVNWRAELIDALQESDEGDEIDVRSYAQLELAHKTHQRMCPKKRLHIACGGRYMREETE